MRRVVPCLLGSNSTANYSVREDASIRRAAANKTASWAGLAGGALRSWRTLVV